MNKVTTIEISNDKTGAPMKVTMFDNGDKVFVNSKWDSAIYDKVVEGAEFELVKEGNFNKIKYDKPASFGGGSKVEKLMDKKADNIKVAQERKNDAIAFFNATNSAISLRASDKTLLFDSTDHQKEYIVFWRNWFLEEWQKYDSQDYTDKHQAF